MTLLEKSDRVTKGGDRLPFKCVSPSVMVSLGFPVRVVESDDDDSIIIACRSNKRMRLLSSDSDSMVEDSQ
jgi:hypothetical protein